MFFFTDATKEQFTVMQLDIPMQFSVMLTVSIEGIGAESIQFNDVQIVTSDRE